PFDKYVRQKLYNHTSEVPNGLWKGIAAQNIKPEIPIYQTFGFKFLLFSAFISFFALVWFLVDQPIENKVAEQGKIGNQLMPSSVIGNILAEENFRKNNATSNKFNNLQLWYEETHQIAENAVVQNPTPSTGLADSSTLHNSDASFLQHDDDFEGGFFADNIANKLEYPSFFTEVVNKSKIINAGYAKAMQQMNAATIATVEKQQLSANNEWQYFLSSNQFQPYTTPLPKTATYFLEVYASANLDMPSIFNYGVTESYLQRKDSAETMQTGFTAGFRIGKYITNNLVIKGGLQYTQINKLFALRSENERITTPVIVNRTITNPDGTTSIVPDTSYVTQIGTRITKANNRYKSIEIPLMLGYEFGKSKWHFAVNAGAIVRATYWSEGTTFDTNNTLVSLEDKSRTYYHKQTHLSAVGSISIIRYL
ncbi:MAG: hypothetical protein ACOVNR_09250, partial [Chitinophagaceae bacterium]